MNKLAYWRFEQGGPTPARFKFTEANFIAEQPGESIADYEGRVVAMAASLPEGATLVINCEGFGDRNLSHAVRLAFDAKLANRKIKVGVYTTPANGDLWGITGNRSLEANVEAKAELHKALRAIEPFVDFFCVDLFDCETDQGKPVRFYARQFNDERNVAIDRDASWAAIAQARVTAIVPFGKPWMGFFGPNVISGTDKTRSTVLDKNRLYSRAAWCKANGAQSIFVMVFDPDRRKAEGTGAVASTPEIEQALNAIGQI